MLNIIGKKYSVPYDARIQKEKHGFNGKILHIDLSIGEIWVDEPEESFYRSYMGGRGFILYYLLSELPKGIDALDPENLLIFAPGVLTGSILPGSSRHAVGAKSPLTNALASSEAGGWWGAELKRTGFDAVVVHGKAAQPVYLWIKDGIVEIRDAGHLWGKLTGDVQDIIREELGDDRIRISQIGPAGENLVRYACVMNNANRAAGRSGLGAVMGSKNLKAIAVRGAAAPGIADRSRLTETLTWIAENYKTLVGWAVAAGTAGSVKFLHDAGSTPINNYRSPVFEGIEQLDAENLFPLMLKERDSCHGCPIRCKIVVEHDSGKYVTDSRYGGPEYESIGGLGPLCMVNDPVVVAKANELCAAYGLDTISTGGTIAFVMECVEKGILQPDQGYSSLPIFGNGDSLIECIHLIANRQDIGAMMAEGSERMAQELGVIEEMVVAVKGQEFPLHDPRLRNIQGMGYALSPTGADHNHNMGDNFANDPTSDVCSRLQELGFQIPLSFFGITNEKVRAFTYETAYKHFQDSAVICHFHPYRYKHMVEALSSVTGWSVTQDEIVDMGMRITTMARMFLQREGFTAADDQLPSRIFMPHSSGPLAGKAPALGEMQKGIRTYYQLMGWGENGVPSQATLARLNLSHWL